MHLLTTKEYDIEGEQALRGFITQRAPELVTLSFGRKRMYSYFDYNTMGIAMGELRDAASRLERRTCHSACVEPKAQAVAIDKGRAILEVKVDRSNFAHNAKERYNEDEKLLDDPVITQGFFFKSRVMHYIERPRVVVKSTLIIGNTYDNVAADEIKRALGFIR